MDKEHLMILGTGPAGYTAAIYAARANLHPLVIEGNEPGGQLMLTTEVENFPGFPEGVMGPDLMEAMKKQAERFGARFQYGWVTSVDFSQRPLQVSVDDSLSYAADAVIVATGASAKLLGIPGESELIGHGVSTCATCDGFFFRNKSLIVIGGGDSAMEEALFLTKYASDITIVHRRDALRASKVMQERAHNHPKIRWALNLSPLEVVGEDNRVVGMKVKDNASGEIRVIPADGIFVAIGHAPNTGFLQGILDTDRVGYIKTQGLSTATNIEGVFACGDVADPHYRQAITAAGSGCRAAMDAEKWLENSPLPS
ncbi:MAG: thioredoxin-disulfide reductase [Thermaerobacter sp.]|nr:thioredoxin-disulfide reductase [Thermaerobacter sp.]